MGKNEVQIIVTAEDKASGVLSGISGALGSVGRIATGAALGGVALVGGAMALAGRSAIQMNSDLETSQLQFETLMGDAERAEEHVRGLFDFAAKTPFETGPIIEASRIMQVFGGDALNTEENLTHIGNTAAAVGAPIEDIGFWVGRAYSAIQGGQPFGEAAQNLMQMGAVSPDVISRMQELQESGAGADEIFAVLQDHMGTFGGAMEKQAGTWQGLMATIKDSMDMAAAEALKPFFDLAKQGLAGLATWFNSPAIQNGIKMLAEKLTVIIQAVADFVSGIMSGEDPVGDLANLAWSLAGAFGGTEEQAKKVFEAVRKLGDKVTEFIRPIWQAITRFISLKDVLIALGLVITGVIIVAIANLVIAMAPILLAIGAVIAIVALLRNAWENNWGGIQEKTAAVLAFIQGIIQAFIAKVQAWWQAHGAAILATAKRFWELIQGLIDGVIKHIQLIVEAFRLAFEGDWEGFGRKIFEIWENAWNTVVNFLSGLWNMILPWLLSLWENIKTWFTSTDWPALGRAIIDGIINGINNAAHALFDIVRGLASEALEVIKNALGIESPSKVTTHYGKMLGEGLTRGIQSQVANVQKAMGDMADATQINTGGSRFGLGEIGNPSSFGRAGLPTNTGGVVVNIDARGAAKGADADIKRAVAAAMREYGSKADIRMRTV